MPGPPPWVYVLAGAVGTTLLIVVTRREKRAARAFREQLKAREPWTFEQFVGNLPEELQGAEEAARIVRRCVAEALVDLDESLIRGSDDIDDDLAVPGLEEPDADDVYRRVRAELKRRRLRPLPKKEPLTTVGALVAAVHERLQEVQ
jgi:hypothetical protein